jgi:hypothetical protein
MLTLVLQQIGPVILAAFGLLAIRIGRHRSGDRQAHLSAWFVAGGAHLVDATQAALQATFAVWAFLSGKGTAPYDAYVHSQPIGNGFRGFVMVGFSLLLLVGLVRKRIVAIANSRSYWLWIGIWGFAGAGVGYLELSRTFSEHFQTVTVVEAVELLLLLPALWIAVNSDAMDYLLWLALSTYAVREVLSVAITSGLAYFFIPQAWSPRPWVLQAWFVVTNMLMCALALRRQSLLNRNIAVPPLFGLDGSTHYEMTS